MEVTAASLQQTWEFARSPSRVAAMNLAVGWTIVGEFDLRAARRAVRDVVRRHEVLRSSVTEIDGRVVQVVSSRLRVSIPLVDLSDVRRDRRARELQRAITARLRRPFRMDRLPQIRPSLVRVSRRQHILLLVVSHTVWDASSAELFLAEFRRSYAARVDGRCSPPPALAVQLADVADWEARHAALPRDVRARWTAKAAWRPSDLPARAADGRQTLVMNAPMPMLPRWAVSRLRQIAQSSSTTPAIGLAAGMAAVLYTRTGERTQVVALSRDTRTHLETRPVIGYLVEYLPLEVQLYPESSFRSIAIALRDELRSASIDGVTMTRLRAPWTDPRRLTGIWSSAVAVNPVLAPSDPAVDSPDQGLTIKRFLPATWHNAFARDGLWECGVLNAGFAGVASNGRIAGRLCFDARWLDPESAKRLAREFVVLLRLLVLHPDAPLMHVQRLAGRLLDRAAEQAFTIPTRPSGLLAHRPQEFGSAA